jgi:hypothetical protein
VLSTTSLIRYALPGGYGILVAGAYEAAYGWAWHRSAASAISTAQVEPIATIGGAVIVGFAVSEIIYQQLDCACLNCVIAIRLPRWMPASWCRRGAYEIAFGTFYAADLGGAVLSRLLDLPAFRQTLGYAHGISQSHLAHRRPPPGATEAQRAAYAARLRRHLAAMHTYVRLAASTGEPEIHRNYEDRIVAYHAIGLSRVMLCTVSGSALIDIAAKHQRAVATHLTSSIEVSVMLAFIVCLTWRLLSANRHNRWVALVEELSHDLRSWALRHPRELSQLAGVPCPPAGCQPADGTSPCPVQAGRHRCE